MPSPSPTVPGRAVRVCAVALLCLSSVAVAGCGSDDRAATPTAAPTSTAAGSAPAATGAAPRKVDVQAEALSIAVHVVNVNPAARKLGIEVPGLDSFGRDLVRRHGRTDRTLRRGERLVDGRGAIKEATVTAQPRTRFFFESVEGKVSVSSLAELASQSAPTALLTWYERPAKATLSSLLAEPVDEVRIIEPEG